NRHCAPVRLGCAGHEFQQGRFSGAVNAEKAPALPASDHEIQPVVDRPAAIGLVHVLEADDIFTRSWRRQKIKVHCLAATWWFHAFDLVELLYPALYLSGMRGARLEPFDEFQFLGKHRLLAL